MRFWHANYCLQNHLKYHFEANGDDDAVAAAVATETELYDVQRCRPINVNRLATRFNAFQTSISIQCCSTLSQVAEVILQVLNNCLHQNRQRAQMLRIENATACKYLVKIVHNQPLLLPNAKRHVLLKLQI